MSMLHACLRAILFFLLTFVHGIIAFIGGLSWRLTGGLFTKYHPLAKMAYWWSWQVNQWCFRPINFRWEFDPTCKTFHEDRRLKIVIFNHPPTLLTWGFAYLTGLLVSPRLAFVLKASHRFNPMGWGLWGLGLGIFTSRLHKLSIWKRWPNLQRALHERSIANYCAQVHSVMERSKQVPGGIGIVESPNSRYSRERFAEALRLLHGLIPDLHTWDHQLPPHYLGLLELLAASKGIDVAVIWINVTLDTAESEGWLNFKPYIDGVAHVDCFEITEALRFEAPGQDLSRFGENPTALRDWLNQFYSRQNLRARTRRIERSTG